MQDSGKNTQLHINIPREWKYFLKYDIQLLYMKVCGLAVFLWHDDFV